MKVRIEIEVRDMQEKRAIERALVDPPTRALVLITGLLLPFSERAQARVLNFVLDQIHEEASA